MKLSGLALAAAVALAATGPLTTSAVAASGDGDEIFVTITSPPPRQPVFGEVDVTVDAWPQELIESVELFVDGDFAGRLQSPPYRFRVDVGEANEAHRFEAVVRSSFETTRTAQVTTPSLRIDERLELELRQLYVTVSRDEERILDLDRSDFQVIDDGALQELVTFERGDVPLAALLLVDASVSMRGRPLEAALRGAAAFVDGMRPLDRAKLLLYSDRVIHTTPFTGFGAVLTAGLETARAAGGTALNDHLYLALRLLEKRQGRRVIVLLSDGVDVASVLDMRDVEWAARRSQALVYWIRLGRPDRDERRFSAWRDAEGHRGELLRLEGLISRTGGRILHLDSIDATEDAFAGVLRELREQYVLGYYPSRNRDDGSWRKVRVRVGRPGLEVRTRDGYLDD